MEKNQLPGRDQVSKIAAAYGSVPTKLGKKLPPEEEDFQNVELDRALDKLVESYKPPTDQLVVEFSDVVSTPQDAGEQPEVTASHYTCPECGHLNAGENRFCGMCGAAHGETRPASGMPEGGSAESNFTAVSGIKHYHHHHYHYPSSPFLMLSVGALLAVSAWHAGWEYSRSTRMPLPTMVPAPIKSRPVDVPNAAKTNSQPANTEAGGKTLEESPAEQSSSADAQGLQQDPYPNELQGFKFYSRDLAPLRPGISGRAAVVRLLGYGTRVISGWSIIPAYTTKAGSVDNSVLSRLAEIIIRPEGVIPMGAVKFPATFTHCHAAVPEMNLSFDVYSDNWGLEYWLHEEDSKWGRKGELYRIVYRPSKRHC